MTPAARVQAAIECLDAILRGASAERTLTAWARRSRFAGSKDRAAVRDHVFDALRRLRSSAWLGGAGDVPPPAMDARGVMAGLLRGQGADPAALFDASRHGPARWDGPEPLPLEDAPAAVRADLPDWAWTRLRAARPGDAGSVAAALRDRAGVHLRVNAAKTDRDAVVARLRRDGYDPRPGEASPCAVVLDPGTRGLADHDLHRTGHFEFQDAGSQALVDRLPLAPADRVLDLCAGGGGKALAMAARMPGTAIDVHDANPGRMADLPARAARAGASLRIVDEPAAGAYDFVVADVPCSGSGAWRRQPEARWRLDEAAMDPLARTQRAILARALHLVRPGGQVAYMTCSAFSEENDAVVDGVGAEAVETLRWRCGPDGECDGFFLWVGQRAAESA